MDSEFHSKYMNLTIQHLQRDEVEFELEIREIQFRPEETLSVLRRRLDQELEKRKDNPDELDFALCSTRSIEEEVQIIDEKLNEIRDYLKREEIDDVNDELGTQLVHYFIRCFVIQRFAEEEEDLIDLDKLVDTVRRLYATYSIRKEVLINLNESITQIRLNAPNVQLVSRATQTEPGDFEDGQTSEN